MRNLFFTVCFCLMAGPVLATSPQPIIPTSGVGLYHEFNDLHATYGYDYQIGATAYYTWNSPGVFTHTSNVSDYAADWQTADALGDPTPMVTVQDWVAKFTFQKDGDVNAGKAIELKGSESTLLQVDLLADGRITFVYGPENFGFQQYTTAVDVFEEGVMHDFIVHYKSSVERLDVWVDDALILSNIVGKTIGMVGGGTYDLYHAPLRGPCSYDEEIFGGLVPEPMTLVLLGLGGLALTRKRACQPNK